MNPFSNNKFSIKILDMELISLDLLKSLPVLEQIKIKVGIIETNDLSMIPPSYLPPVHSKDYYFVSYSHRDFRAIYRDIYAFQSAGLQIWYDRGIPAGKDWRDVANRYMGPSVCRGVLFYLSESSLISDAVMDELSYALAHKKSLFSINLPFVSDYVHNGESVKGKIFSASEMVDILKENGVPISEERCTLIKSSFPDSVIFLPVSMDARQRAEKIISSSVELPKILTSYKEKGWYTADSCSDPLTETIELSDFDDFKLKPNALTAIGRCAFSNHENLVSAHVCAHSINDYAFFRCVNLKEFKNTPNANSRTINCWNASFMRCRSLTDIDIAQFSYIGEEAFSTCESLQEAHIEAKHVGRSAFYRCYNLKRVFLGKDVSYLGPSCFDRCYSLEEFVVDERNECFYAKNGSLYEKESGKRLYKVANDNP